MHGTGRGGAWLALGLLIGVLSACGNDGAAHGAQTNISMRAEYIKMQIEINKNWSGCDSPVPCLAVTENTFKAVRKQISLQDSAALMMLLQDEDYGTRSMAAYLLGCVNPNARSEIKDLIVAEKNTERKDRFEDALIDIDGIASCK